MKEISIKAFLMIFVSVLSAQAIADEIGHGNPTNGTNAAPIEEDGATASSTDSFFNELLDVFLLDSDE